jgi:3-deoxy-D-arabino-heptulosonate 7-phosphate (DAHP) synthase
MATMISKPITINGFTGAIKIPRVDNIMTITKSISVPQSIQRLGLEAQQ